MKPPTNYAEFLDLLAQIAKIEAEIAEAYPSFAAMQFTRQEALWRAQNIAHAVLELDENDDTPAVTFTLDGISAITSTQKTTLDPRWLFMDQVEWEAELREKQREARAARIAAMEAEHAAQQSKREIELLRILAKKHPGALRE